MLTTSKIYWGAYLENILEFGWPLDSIVPRRTRRGGSVRKITLSGIEDSWNTGRDFGFEAVMRWTPPGKLTSPSAGIRAGISSSGWTGPQGVEAFIAACEDGLSFRLVPDVTWPLFYIDGCYLVTPENVKPALEQDGWTWQVRVTLRHPTVDIAATVLRGIMFEFEVGESLSDFNITATRGSTGTRTGVDGLVATDAVNVLRDRHYIGGTLGVGGGSRVASIEQTAINMLLRSRDLSNAAWTKSNMTAVRTQVGVDGVANSASLLTATAGNATCLQAITSTLNDRNSSVFIKRSAGTGNIQMTQDNGSTWTTLTLTAAWTRVSIPYQNLANPTVGFRVVTNGDAVIVDFVQHEFDRFITNPIETTSAQVTRSVDVVQSTLPVGLSRPPFWLYLKFVEGGSVLTAGSAGGVGIGQAGASSFGIFAAGGVYTAQHVEGSAVYSPAGSAPNIGDTVELLAILFADGSVQLRQSINGAVETAGTVSAPLAIGAAWTSQLIQLGGLANAYLGNNGVEGVRLGAGSSVNTVSLARLA